MVKKFLLLSLLNLVATTNILKAPFGDEIAPAYHDYAPSCSSSQAAAEEAATQRVYFILGLPDELLEFISGFLEHKDLRNLSRTHKTIYTICWADQVHLCKDNVAAMCVEPYVQPGKYHPNGNYRIADRGMHPWKAVVQTRHSAEQMRFEPPIQELNSDLGGVRCAAYSPNGSRIATISDTGEILEWINPGENCAVRRFPQRHVFSPFRRCYIRSFIHYSPSGNVIATASSLDGAIALWNAKTGELISCCLHNENSIVTDMSAITLTINPNHLEFMAIIFLPDEDQDLLVSYSPGKIIFWPNCKKLRSKTTGVELQLPCNGSKIARLCVSDNVHSIGFSKVGHQMLLRDRNHVEVFNIEDQRNPELICKFAQRNSSAAFVDGHPGHILCIPFMIGDRGILWHRSSTLKEIDQQIAEEQRRLGNT